MFTAERLLYLELQKTGGSHIRRLLKQYTDGTVDGKHNRLNKKPDDKLIIGSIRNPWDWYVSLWAYGVSGQGAIRERTTSRIDMNYYYRGLPKAMGKNWLSPSEFFHIFTNDLFKPVSRWHETYGNASDPVLFQAWLKLMLNKDRGLDSGEGYGFSPMSKHSGLMTYRYFRLYTTGNRIFTDEALSRYSYISDFDRKYNITGAMIRNESLESDLLTALEKSAYKVSHEAKERLLNKAEGKTNASVRKPAIFYYNDETLSLVAEKEKYLIEKYNYVEPC